MIPIAWDLSSFKKVHHKARKVLGEVKKPGLHHHPVKRLTPPTPQLRSSCHRLPVAPRIEALVGAIAERAQKSRKWLALPLHSQMPVEQQDRCIVVLRWDLRFSQSRNPHVWLTARRPVDSDAPETESILPRLLGLRTRSLASPHRESTRLVFHRSLRPCRLVDGRIHLTSLRSIVSSTAGRPQVAAKEVKRTDALPLSL